MKYQQRVQLAADLIDRIERGGEQTSDHDQFLLRLVRRYRDQMTAATNTYEARIAISTLSRCWVDSGDWNSPFSDYLNQLLTPVKN